MKRIAYLLFAGSVLLASCSREYDDPVAPVQEEKPVFHMTVLAGEDATKTAVADDGAGGYSISWQSGDKLGVFEVDGGAVQAKATSEPLASGGANANFSFSLDGDLMGPFDYTFVYPSSALTFADSKYQVTLPASQTFAADSFDPKADVLVSQHINSETRPTSVEASFARLGGTARMEILAPTTSEKIRWIQFSTTETNLAGSYQLTPGTGELADEMLAGEKTIILHPAAATDYTGSVVVWFRLAAVTLAQNFTVTVQTDTKKYVKAITFTAGRTLQFANGRLTTFALDMTGVDGTPAPVDVIDLAFTGVTKAQQYTNWEYAGSSGALYKGNSQKPGASSTTLGLRSGTSTGSSQHSGIVTTQSAKYIKQIVVHLPSQSGRRLDIYVKDTPYSDPNDLFGTGVQQGTLLKSVSSSADKAVSETINLAKNYMYLGIRSYNGLTEINEIDIAWQEGKMATATVTTGAASEITSSRANLAGSFAGASGTIYETGFYWDTDEAALASLAHPEQVITTDGSNEASGDIFCTLGSLNEQTTYYYKAYVLEYDEENLCYVERFGDIESFQTLAKASYTPTGWLELPNYTVESMAGTTTSPLDNLYPITHWATVNEEQQRNYTLLYDPDMYASYWVAYPLNKDHLSSGRNDSWAFDPDVPEYLQTNLTNGAYGVNVVSEAYPSEQYYARGHQIPNADRNGIAEMQAQTYYMTNVTPQLQNGFNAHIWGDLEEAVRNLVKNNNKTVYVVTGAAFRKKGGSEPIKTIVNKRDGKTIPVPNYYWKVVLKVTWDQDQVVGAKTIGFWLEHRDDLKVLQHKTYDNFATTVDQIEAWTGFDFFVNIGDLQTSAEANADWNAFKSY